jgi:hypothetical protein
MDSRARPIRAAAVAILTTWLTACGPDTVLSTVPAGDLGYRSLGVQDEAALGVTASGILADIGCRPLRGSPDSSTIAIRLVPPRVQAYQCHAVSQERIRAAVRAVRQLVLANPRWASVQSEAGDGGGGSGYYVYDHIECIWHCRRSRRAASDIDHGGVQLRPERGVAKARNGSCARVHPCALLPGVWHGANTRAGT